MKTIYILAILAGLGGSVAAQSFSSVDGALTVQGGILKVKGDLQLGGGSFTNNGSVFVSGNLVNNQAMAEVDTGSLILDGTATQTVSGTQTYFTRFLTIDNAAGIVLDNSIKVGGTVNLLNGIVEATNAVAALVIGDTASVAGVSDERHVNGYVVKTGTGSFVYPVGDGIRYQPVTVELTDNSAGMSVRYFDGDAGTAPFATTGGSHIALEAYNNEEYWDLAPKGTATGKVIITYDDYKNPSITVSENPNVFSVAHLTGGSWLNEGHNVTGTLTAGTVTSEVISSWSPFTLGAIPEAGLPVTLVSFNAKAVENNALLEWQTTSEENASHFEVERSFDARSFQKIGTVAAAGNSNELQRYYFTDRSFGSQLQTVYYRLRSVDLDGTFSFSRAVSLQPRGTGQLAGVYPNPARRTGMVTVSSGIPASEVSLWDMLGRQIPARTSALSDGSMQVSLNGVASGMYLLKLTTSQGVVNHKLVVE
ncbi:Por secretion system C-terminal sorting domain-containing protein [Dyadobacter sp. SG02]|uniref:T9SS type A sorting domain-containing protein n=1 Tax=Dyadobacter sp. SG02 TaxID=1855291 RepID=UPI0008C54C37|nr:T9SS type A sorting domain-containing protein [Dyadobacter sp. SG02]SEI57545.1 Por secretion system C-terminal sorting domain-containing protein [Dyadobacter sp. SG02]